MRLVPPPVEEVPPRPLRFGDFELDLGAGELRRRGVRVKLQEQPLQMLAALLERPGRVVTRDELARRLWPGVVVDFEHGLDTTVNKLRAALADDAESPRFVETLPRRGYRFIHPLGAGLPAEPAPPRARRLARRPAAVLAALAVLAAASAIAYARWPRPPAIRSLAVLPLKNHSADPQHELFADAVTESLVTELGKIGAVRVLSYQTMARHRGSAAPLGQLARELGVDAVLEGAVALAGARARVTVGLYRGAPERSLWSQTYEFDLGDVLAVQAEVARDAARRLRLTLTPAEEERLAVSQRVHPDAYTAYQLGRQYLFRTPTANTQARVREHLQRAIAIDPGFALPHSALAVSYIGTRGLPLQEPAEIRREARRHAERALELDPTLAEPHAVLARVAQQEWDWARAEREYRRAIELNPGYARAHLWYGMFLYAMLRLDEGVAEAERAQRLDPAAPAVNTWAAAGYNVAGRTGDALASCERALELAPGDADASLVLAQIHLRARDHEQAIAALERSRLYDDRQPLVLGALASALAQAGRRGEALALVDDLERMEAEGRVFVPPFGLIWAYAGLGDADRAFAKLERAVERRSDRVVWLSVDSRLDPLRPDPRFEAILRRVGLPGSPPPR